MDSLKDRSSQFSTSSFVFHSLFIGLKGPPQQMLSMSLLLLFPKFGVKINVFKRAHDKLHFQIGRLAAADVLMGIWTCYGHLLTSEFTFFPFRIPL
jgi:hypothetical protein